jgi:hypothetical protein
MAVKNKAPKSHLEACWIALVKMHVTRLYDSTVEIGWHWLSFGNQTREGVIVFAP